MAGTSQKTESGTIVLQTEHWAHRSELCIPDGLRMEQMVTGIIWIQHRRDVNRLERDQGTVVLSQLGNSW